MNSAEQNQTLFRQLHDSLPPHLRSLLLKDMIYEMTSAWKFFSALNCHGSALVFSSGLTSIPLAIARHLHSVDIIGLDKNEIAIFKELAAFKKIKNYRILDSVDEVSGSYSTVIIIPAAHESKASLLNTILAWLKQRSVVIQELFIILRQATKQKLVKRSKSVIRKLLGDQSIPPFVNLCFQPEFIATEFQLPANGRALTQNAMTRISLNPVFVDPQYISMSTRDEMLRKRFGKLKVPGRIKAEHTVVKYVTDPPPVTFLERLVVHLTQKTNDDWYVGHYYRVHGGGKVQIELRRNEAASPNSAFLKLALVPNAEMRLRENTNNLIRLAQSKEIKEEHRQFFPRVLAEGICEKQSYYLEGRIRGRSLDRFPYEISHAPQQIHEILSLWFNIQSQMINDVKVTDTIFQSVFINVTHRIQEWLKLDEKILVRLKRVTDYWYTRFSGRQLKLGLVHGDFSIKNIMIDRQTKKVTGIIDWDLTDFFSIPLLDVLHFFVRMDSKSFQDTPPVIALKLVTDINGIHAGYLQNAIAQYGYEPEDWHGIVMLYWLFRQRGYIGSPKNLDSKFVRRQFLDVLDLFEREVLV